MDGKNIELYNGDCLEILPELKGRGVDLVLVDLPYGQTACEWDSVIDLQKMWKQLKKCSKHGSIYAFFCTTKFGFKLIESNPKWFRYDLVWEKSKKVGFLNANIMPLRKHEMIYIFATNNNYDLDNSRNLGLREYARKVHAYINRPLKEIDKAVGNQGIHHFFQFNSTQFSLPTAINYNKLIQIYELDKMEGFREYEDIKSNWENPSISGKTYNPQKTQGKPYKSTGKNSSAIYGIKKRTPVINKTGDRHPASVIYFPNDPDNKSLHPTQKPVELCEWLIKTYSNEGELVLDFTMGSGTTGVACINTKRRFIGIEMDPEIFKTAEKRINDTIYATKDGGLEADHATSNKVHEDCRGVHGQVGGTEETLCD